MQPVQLLTQALSKNIEYDYEGGKIQEPKVVLSISKLMPHKFSMIDQSHRKRYPSFN